MTGVAADPGRSSGGEATEPSPAPPTDGPASGGADPGAAPGTPWWKEGVGVIVTAIVSMAVTFPALRNGSQLGEYDWGEQFGLLHRAGVPVHYSFSSDQIAQMIPWTALSWTQVHHGLIPLWNPYSVLGMPLAFNWQSAAFSVPSLIGYLFPLHLAYTVQILVTLAVAGTGAYTFTRVTGGGVVASTLAGSAFALSGPLFAWIGWPIATVLSCTGWVLVGVVLVVKGTHRAGAVVLLAGSIAMSVYAGQPDALVLLGVAAVTFTVAYLIASGAVGQLLRPVRTLGDLALGGVAGIGLSLPLLLPGYQLLEHSVRSGGGSALDSQTALPWNVIEQVFVLELAGRRSFFPTMQYLGLIPATLAVLALVTRLRRPETAALAATLVVSILLFAVNPTMKLANDFPGLHAVRFPRAIVIAAFCVAALAGSGADALRRAAAGRTTGPARDRRTASVALALFAVSTGLAVVLSVWGLAEDPPGWAVVLHRDMEWIVGTTFAGLVASGFVVVATRWRNGDGTPPVAARRSLLGAAAIVILLVGSVTLLVDRGKDYLASVHATPTTPAARQLRSLVGDSLIGLGSNACQLSDPPGMLANVNVMYGLDQFSVYDPLTPASYFSSWSQVGGGSSPGFAAISRFCPVVTTVHQAQIYGIRYVLEPFGIAGPAGAKFVALIGGEELFRVPGSAAVSLTGGTAHWHGVGSTHIVVTSSSRRSSFLTVRVSAVPGWHATLDGRPLALTTVDQIMLGATLPAGSHRVELTYWPTTFTVGLAGAGATLLAGILFSGIWVARRRRPNPEA